MAMGLEIYLANVLVFLLEFQSVIYSETLKGVETVLLMVVLKERSLEQMSKPLEPKAKYLGIPEAHYCI